MWEHVFVTAQGSSGAIFWRAVQHGNVIGAEVAAREIPVLPLDYALALVHLYGEKRDRRYERAALRYLERYMAETNPSLDDLAGVAALLAERKPP
jgi:hypothetical protein